MPDKNLKKRKLFFIFGFVFSFFFVNAANAASLYFSPSSGSYKTGSIISLSLYVSSADQAMNAASGVISFPADKLEVISISKISSIFNLWVQEPSFSNSAGTVNFEGVVLNPGFTGSVGKLITLNFKAKTAGLANLNLSSSLVLANDGQGTNILSEAGGANFSIILSDSGGLPDTSAVPAAPSISSNTHPDQNKWYSANDAEFSWSLPHDVTIARLFASRIPNSIPTVNYSPAISSKKIDDLEDGVWYFSARLRNNEGWGPVSIFRFQVDTAKPELFEISEIARADQTEPKAKFSIEASDKTSGIDYFEFKIGNGDFQIWRDDGNHKYETPVLEPSKYTLIARAVDKAGNKIERFINFDVEALESPSITSYPKEITSKEALIIKGETKYPNIKVNIWLKNEKEEAKNYPLMSDANGKFTFVADEEPSNKIYTAWAEVIKENGAKSKPSEKVTIKIKLPLVIRIGTKAIGLLSVVIPFVALILILIYFLWHWWHKISNVRKKLEKEIKEAEKHIYESFDSLKKVVHEQIDILEETRTKRNLTEEEEKIYNKLKTELGEEEEFVKKEIGEIEKIIK